MTAEEIVAVVAAEYDTMPKVIASRCRKRNVAEARMMAMLIMHRLLGCSKTRIGKVFERTHVTVALDIRRMEALIDTDRQTALHYDNAVLKCGFATS